MTNKFISPVITILTKHNKKESLFFNVFFFQFLFFFQMTTPCIAGLLLHYERRLNKLFKASSVVHMHFLWPVSFGGSYREILAILSCANVSMVPGFSLVWFPGGWDVLVAGEVMRRRNITKEGLLEYSQTSLQCFTGFKKTWVLVLSLYKNFSLTTVTFLSHNHISFNFIFFKI